MKASKFSDAQKAYILKQGRAATHSEIARSEGVSDRHISQVLPLAFLAPDITEAILAG